MSDKCLSIPLVVEFTKDYESTFFFWEFGDGNTSTYQNPTHTYTNTSILLKHIGFMQWVFFLEVHLDPFVSSLPTASIPVGNIVVVLVNVVPSQDEILVPTTIYKKIAFKRQEYLLTCIVSVF